MKAKYYIIKGDDNKIFAINADEYRSRRGDYEPYCLGAVYVKRFVNRSVLEYGTFEEYEELRRREAVEKFNRRCFSQIEKQAKRLYGKGA